jgi:hypothetical protein
MLALSDDKLGIVMTAAAPIPRHARDEFLRAVAVELGRFELLGPGIVSRVTSRLQREHLSPRSLTGVGSKWDR